MRCLALPHHATPCLCCVFSSSLWTDGRSYWREKGAWVRGSRLQHARGPVGATWSLTTPSGSNVCGDVVEKAALHRLDSGGLKQR